MLLLKHPDKRAMAKHSGGQASPTEHGRRVGVCVQVTSQSSVNAM